MTTTKVSCLLGLGFVVAACPSAMGQSGSTQTTTKTTTTTTTTGNTSKWLHLQEYDTPVKGYLGVDDFFNVREANSNVRTGQWQLELNTYWETYRSGSDRDDDLSLSPSIKYGVTDDFNAELEVFPINFGDGLNLNNSDAADGTAEANLKLFWQFAHEQDWMPAMALWGEARIPSGENSAKIDGTLHLNVTKTYTDVVRGHLTGYVKSANGARGDRDRDESDDFTLFGLFDDGDDDNDRRDVQWGVGFGFDFQINDSNVLVLDYLARSSEYNGNSNAHLIEAGWVYRINEAHSLSLAANVDVGESEGAHWTGKVQWAIAF